MTIPDILALDFDGVCCDGLREYFETSRRTCARVWPADEPPAVTADPVEVERQDVGNRHGRTPR